MRTIYFGGPIITMEGENDRPEAVLVEDGKIKKAGTLDEVCKAVSGRVEMRNLDGRCLMPGFVDPHGHITMNGQMSLCADLSECVNFDEIVAVLKKFITDNKITAKNAVVGYGYDHNFLEEKSHPTRAVLDKASTEIPIMAMHISGHLGCANSPAIKAAGISAETPDIEGGKIGRIPGTMEPDGYFEEGGLMMLQPAVRKLVKVDINKMLSTMEDIYIKNGVTTVQDGATTAPDLKMLKAANTLGKLKIDVVAYPLLSSDGRKLAKKNKSFVRKYRKHLKIGGYKLVLDGSPQGRSAWVTKPYLGGEEGYCGYPWMKDEEVEKYITQTLKDGQQLLAHCNGDAAGDQLLSLYKKAYDASDNPDKDKLRPTMIHCQLARNDQLDKMAELNMIASIFVSHVYYWGNIHLMNFGPERGEHISPVKDALDRGLIVNFHTDTPVTKPKMLHSVWCAVNRINRDGNVIGADQAISVYEALKAITINGAYEYFEEDSKGSIKEGKRADMVILDRCPLDVDKMEIKDIEVLETIKDGRTIYKA